MIVQRPAHLGHYLAATVLPVILFTATLALVIYDKVRIVEQTSQEIQGSETLDLLFLDLTSVQQLRGLTQIALRKPARDKETTEEIHRLQTELIDRLNHPLWQQRSRQFGFADEAGQLTKHIQALNEATPTSLDADPLFAAYTDLTSIILQLMALTADRSRLVLDPDLDTHYLIDVLVVQIPALSEAIGRLRGMGAGVLGQSRISPGEIHRIQGYRSVIESRLETIRREQQVLSKISPILARELDLLPPRLERTLQRIWLQCRIIEGKDRGQPMAPEQFFSLATTAIEALFPTYRRGIVLLRSNLERRRNRTLWQGILIFCATSVAILIMLSVTRSYFLKNQALQQQLAELSITDQLTGLFNRRHLKNIFPHIIRSASRHGSRLYLASLDVDHFKRYNDRYGHPAGDIALQRVAALMREVFQREDDLCFRIGGEEFGILYATRTAEGAQHIAERLRRRIETQGISHEGNPPWRVLTVSLGLLAIPDDPDYTLDQALIVVDRALYRAKDEGRNRIVQA